MPHKIMPVIIALLSCACGDSVQGESDSAALQKIHATAVANPQRSDADRDRDAGRNPAAVLDFFGIAPGMSVLDMFSGGGYYTELLSYSVGNKGKVIAHTNSAYANFVGDEAVNRYADGRLPNVEILLAENNALALPTNSFDAVMMVLAYHDIYYIDPENGWPEIDGPQLVEELFDSLKPGGILAIVDHYATAGSARETGNSLHRIDPAIVRKELEAAGFVHDGTSDVLRNAADDHSLHMGDPKVRGKTDRFVMKFRKPDA
jgi:predicted methyltransferase